MTELFAGVDPYTNGVALGWVIFCDLIFGHFREKKEKVSSTPRVISHMKGLGEVINFLYFFNFFLEFFSEFPCL